MIEEPPGQVALELQKGIRLASRGCSNLSSCQGILQTLLRLLAALNQHTNPFNLTHTHTHTCALLTRLTLGAILQSFALVGTAGSRQSGSIICRNQMLMMCLRKMAQTPRRTWGVAIGWPGLSRGLKSKKKNGEWQATAAQHESKNYLNGV